MKPRRVLFLLAFGFSGFLLAERSAEDQSISIDPSSKIQCRMSLTTNGIPQGASGVSVELTNMSQSETFSFEVSKDTNNDTFVVSVTQPGLRGPKYISRPRKTHRHDEHREFFPVSILPGHSLTWSLDFDDVIDRDLISDGVLSNCLVIVHTVTHRTPPPAKALTTYKTNVCISLPAKHH